MAVKVDLLMLLLVCAALSVMAATPRGAQHLHLKDSGVPRLACAESSTRRSLLRGDADSANCMRAVISPQQAFVRKLMACLDSSTASADMVYDVEPMDGVPLSDTQRSTTAALLYLQDPNDPQCLAGFTFRFTYPTLASVELMLTLPVEVACRSTLTYGSVSAREFSPAPAQGNSGFTAALSCDPVRAGSSSTAAKLRLVPGHQYEISASIMTEYCTGDPDKVSVLTAAPCTAVPAA